MISARKDDSLQYVFHSLRPWAKTCSQFHQNISTIVVCKLNTRKQHGQTTDGQTSLHGLRKWFWPDRYNKGRDGSPIHVNLMYPCTTNGVGYKEQYNNVSLLINEAYCNYLFVTHTQLYGMLSKIFLEFFAFYAHSFFKFSWTQLQFLVLLTLQQSNRTTKFQYFTFKVVFISQKKEKKKCMRKKILKNISS